MKTPWEFHKLSVIVPAYNEQATILELLSRVQAVALPKEIIVVDDGSNDQTPVLLAQAGAEIGFRHLRHEHNQGKGAAIRTGLSYVTGEVVIIQDADLELDPQDYHALLQPILTGKSQVVYGSRELHPENPRSFGLFYWGGKLTTWTANLLYGIHITDEPTCYKMFRREVICSLPLKCQRFEFCPEVTARVSKLGLPILEVPIRYRPRSKQEGKKIRWRDGLEALWTLLKYRFWD